MKRRSLKIIGITLVTALYETLILSVYQMQSGETLSFVKVAFLTALYVFMIHIWFYSVPILFFYWIRKWGHAITRNFWFEVLLGSCLALVFTWLFHNQLGSDRWVSLALFASVGAFWGLLHWYFITKPIKRQTIPSEYCTCSLGCSQKIPDGPMKKRFNWLWQFTKVVLGTALIDGLLTGTYFAVLRKIPDYLLFGLLYAFVYHIWFILAAGLLLAGVSGVFPRSVGSLSGLLIAGALIGGLIPYLINTQLSAGLTVETLLFTAVGCSWGYLYWRLISNPAQTKV